MTAGPRPVGPAHGRRTGRGRHRAQEPTDRATVRLYLVGAVTVAGALSALLPPSGAGGPAVDGRPIALAGTSATAEETAAPVRVRLPSIGVDSALLELATDGTGVLVPPTDFARAGWFGSGPPPGEVGPAVIAGHVDSRDGPAVFYRLGELAPGDEVLVDRADGTTARFTVREVGRFPKAQFPTDEVYGTTARAELRLITCGGEFDRGARSYRDNVVVTAW